MTTRKTTRASSSHAEAHTNRRDTVRQARGWSDNFAFWQTRVLFLPAAFAILNKLRSDLSNLASEEFFTKILVEREEHA